MVQNRRKKIIDEREEGADISSGTLANSSNLCLKRDLTNNKYLGQEIRSSPKELVAKIPGSRVIMLWGNTA